MNYEQIWQKVLSQREEVKYEFSVSNKYRGLVLIIWAIISLPFVFLSGIGIFIFIIALFVWYYMKVANAYAFTDKRVIAHTGWLSTKTISVNYEQITDVTVRENFVERIFTKSGKLFINTAGTTSHEIVLKHIDSPYEAKKKLDGLRG